MHDDWPHKVSNNFRYGRIRYWRPSSRKGRQSAFPKLRKTILDAIETKREIWDLQDTCIYISDFPRCKNPYRRILDKIRDTEQLLLPEITTTTQRNSKIESIDDVFE